MSDAMSEQDVLSEQRTRPRSLANRPSGVLVCMRGEHTHAHNFDSQPQNDIPSMRGGTRPSSPGRWRPSAQSPPSRCSPHPIALLRTDAATPSPSSYWPEAARGPRTRATSPGPASHQVDFAAILPGLHSPQAVEAALRRRVRHKTEDASEIRPIHGHPRVYACAASTHTCTQL